MFVYDIKVKKVTGMLKESALPSGNLRIKSKTRLDESAIIEKINGLYQKKYGLTVEAVDGYETPSTNVSVKWGKSGLYKQVAFGLARTINNPKRAYQVTGIRDFNKRYFEEINPYCEMVSDEQYEAWKQDAEKGGSLCFKDSFLQSLENIAKHTQNLIRPKHDDEDYDWDSFSVYDIYDIAKEAVINSELTDPEAKKFYSWIPEAIKSIVKEDLTKLGADGVILKAICDEIS